MALPIFTKRQMESPIYQDQDKVIAAVLIEFCNQFPETPIQYNMEHLGLLTRAAIDRAKEFNITSISEISAFFGLMWIYGPTFCYHPDIYRVLNSKVTASEKIDALFMTVSEEVWDQVAKDRDESAWFTEIGGL